MRTDLVRLDLRLRRRMLIGTALGAAAYLLLVVAVYPSFRHDTAIDTMVSANPAAAAAFGVTGSITSTSGWLTANMYANIAPLLALVLSIGYGATSLAGQDSDGTLGLLASLPFSRRRIVEQKALALLVVSAVVPTASYAACLPGPRFDLTPSWGNLLGVTIGLTLLAFDVGAVALLVGALSGNRGAALGVASAVGGAAYIVSSLAPVVRAFHTIRWLSPFSWAVGNGQLTSGITAGELAALAGLGAILLVGTIAAFQRLDIH